MNRFKSILCVIEHDEAGTPALERAVELAASNQARLTVCDVTARVPAGAAPRAGVQTAADLQVALARRRDAWIDAFLAPYRQRLDVSYRGLVGTPFLEVVREVLRNGHDLVIKCPESPSWLSRFFSGDDMHLLRKCPCPVWFIKPGAPASFRGVLAALDVDDGYPEHELRTRRQLNDQLLELAASMALADSSELHVASAWESITEMASGIGIMSSSSPGKLEEEVEKERRQQWRRLEGLVRDLKSRSEAARQALDYLKPSLHLPKGPARREIPALADRLGVDCIVMGTVGRTGIPGFLIGNTAETIFEQIECSVLAIKPPGFVTPITLEGGSSA